MTALLPPTLCRISVSSPSLGVPPGARGEPDQGEEAAQMRLALSSRPRPRPLASCIRLVPEHLSGQERVRHTDGGGRRGTEGTCLEVPPVG